MLVENLRTSDFVARYGGEEFAILLPHTDVAGALTTTERLKKIIAERPFLTTEGPLYLQVSMGIAQARMCDNEWDLINRADQALLRAKQSGRNQIGIETGWSGALALETESVA